MLPHDGATAFIMFWSVVTVHGGHFAASHKGLLPSLSNFRRKSRRRKSNALRKKAFVLRAGVTREQ